MSAGAVGKGSWCVLLQPRFSQSHLRIASGSPASVNLMLKSSYSFWWCMWKTPGCTWNLYLFELAFQKCRTAGQGTMAEPVSRVYLLEIQLVMSKTVVLLRYECNWCRTMTVHSFKWLFRLVASDLVTLRKPKRASLACNYVHIKKQWKTLCF